MIARTLTLALFLSPVTAEASTCATNWLEPSAPSSIGDSAMGPVMDRLLAAYTRSHPGLRQPTIWSHGNSDAVISSLMFGKADLGPISRPFLPAELAPYDHQYRGDMMKAPFVVTIGRFGDKAATIAVNKRPDAPLPERIKLFLDFALSDEGQQLISSMPDLSPLAMTERLAEQSKLKAYLAPLDSKLRDYRPVASLAGSIRSVGSDGMKDLIDGWQCRFAILQPGVTKGERWEHFGTLNGFHALLASEADIAPMGRELWPQEAVTWRNRFASPMPVEIKVARGGFNTPQRTTAQAIFVHPDNPLRSVTLNQLRGVFGEAPSITRWGQLGLTGAWADRPIVVRMPPKAAPNAVSLQLRLGISGWNPSAQEAPIQPTAQAVLTEPGAIAFGGLEEGLPELRALAVAGDDRGAPVAMDAANSANGRYPLTRFMFIRLADGKPSAATVQFLRYVLSREGQERVRYSGYFPLTADEASVELAKLEAVEVTP